MAEAALTIRNDLSEIRGLAKFAGLFCDANGLEAVEHRLTLVLEELLTNVVAYGYSDDGVHEINIRIIFNDGVLTAVFEDDGRPFDPNKVEIPDLMGSVEDRPVGGLGIHLVLTIADSVDYRRVDGRNRIVITMTPPDQK
jgi:anti-sigma regulatory factor (Ser/Thr protein kinase)